MANVSKRRKQASNSSTTNTPPFIKTSKIGLLPFFAAFIYDSNLNHFFSALPFGSALFYYFT